MSFKVVMTASVLAPRDARQFKKDLGMDFRTVPCNSEDGIIAAARDADAVITFMQPISRRVIENLRRCKLIFIAGTNIENLDLRAATEYGVCVVSAGDYCTQEVAEHTLALLLACARKIARLDKAVRAGEWRCLEKRDIETRVLYPMFPVAGQTLGLVGLGRIGLSVAAIARCLGLKVIGYDPHVAPQTVEIAGIEPVSFTRLLEASDFVSIQARYSPESYHLFGIDQLRKMKPTAYLINVSRGAFVDQTALYKALSTGCLAGAALDVMEEEPDGISARHPLLKLDNVILTAHSAYYSEQSSLRQKRRLYEAVASIVHGDWPERLANPEVKENYSRRWRATETGHMDVT